MFCERSGKGLNMLGCILAFCLLLYLSQSSLITSVDGYNHYTDDARYLQPRSWQAQAWQSASGVNDHIHHDNNYAGYSQHGQATLTAPGHELHPQKYVMPAQSGQLHQVPGNVALAPVPYQNLQQVSHDQFSHTYQVQPQMPSVHGSPPLVVSSQHGHQNMNPYGKSYHAEVGKSDPAARLQQFASFHQKQQSSQPDPSKAPSISRMAKVFPQPTTAGDQKTDHKTNTLRQLAALVKGATTNDSEQKKPSYNVQVQNPNRNLNQNKGNATSFHKVYQQASMYKTKSNGQSVKDIVTVKPASESIKANDKPKSGNSIVVQFLQHLSSIAQGYKKKMKETEEFKLPQTTTQATIVQLGKEETQVRQENSVGNSNPKFVLQSLRDAASLLPEPKLGMPEEKSGKVPETEAMKETVETRDSESAPVPNFLSAIKALAGFVMHMQKTQSSSAPDSVTSVPLKTEATTIPMPVTETNKQARASSPKTVKTSESNVRKATPSSTSGQTAVPNTEIASRKINAIAVLRDFADLVREKIKEKAEEHETKADEETSAVEGNAEMSRTNEQANQKPQEQVEIMTEDESSDTNKVQSDDEEDIAEPAQDVSSNEVEEQSSASGEMEMSDEKEIIPGLLEVTGLPIDKPIKNSKRRNEFKFILKRAANDNNEIMLVFFDEGYFDFALNFAEMVERLHLNNVVFVSLDASGCNELRSRFMWCFVSSYNNDMISEKKASVYGDDDYWMKVNSRHIYILQALEEGYNILHVDPDVYIFADPFPYFQNSTADIQGMLDGEAIMNIGFIYVKPTRYSVGFFSDFVRMINQQPTLNEQGVFNMLLGMISGNSPDFNFEFSDPKVFVNGQDYYDRGKRYFYGDYKPCETCVAVHNNHIISKSGKIYRFKENLQWHVDTDRYYSDPNGKYLSYENVFVTNKTEESLRLEIAALRDALAIAQILNRTLILPKFHCDKATLCPVSSYILMTEFDKVFNGSYRENTFLQNPLVPQEVSLNQSSVHFIDTDFILPTSMRVPTEVITLTASNKRHLTSDEIVEWFGDNGDSVLRLHSLYGAYVSFTDSQEEQAFTDAVMQAFKRGTYEQNPLS